MPRCLERIRTDLLIQEVSLDVSNKIDRNFRGLTRRPAINCSAIPLSYGRISCKQAETRLVNAMQVMYQVRPWANVSDDPR